MKHMTNRLALEDVTLCVLTDRGAIAARAELGSLSALFSLVHPWLFEIDDAKGVVRVAVGWNRTFRRLFPGSGDNPRVNVYFNGAHVAPERLAELALAAQAGERSSRAGSFRDGPATGVGRRGRGRIFRRVRTTAERRASLAVEDDAGWEATPPGRARRNFANLVSYRDEVMLGRSRSWKDHRPTQWKP
jgi:hypothetical protein